MAAVGAGALGASRYVTRRRALIAPVAPDLRHPLLYLPLSLRSRAVLRVIRSLPAPELPVAAGVAVEARACPGPAGADVPLVLYERADRPRPSGALLWVHGGGMVLGTPAQGHPLCSRFAAELGILVVSVDYRLAPEDPFPAGLDDCHAALAWLHEQAAALGVDPDRIAVGGDSAGGGLAAALAQRARDEGGPAICFQLLEYPMLDDRTVLRADHDGRGAFIWTPASNRFAWTASLGHPPSAAAERPYAAPGRTEDLAGLPPAWVGVGDLDLFYEEDVDYAARLAAAGVACELHVEPGMYHGADAVLTTAPPCRSFLDRMTAALAAAVSSVDVT
jgi:acetyl esterase/lipase